MVTYSKQLTEDCNSFKQKMTQSGTTTLTNNVRCAGVYYYSQERLDDFVTKSLLRYVVFSVLFS